MNHAHATLHPPASLPTRQEWLRPSSAEEVRAVLTRWRGLLKAQQPSAMVGLYDAQAVMLATLTDEVLLTPAQKLGYFTSLSARVGIHVTVQKEYLRMLGEDAAVLSGLYSFHFEENGAAITIPARFSMALECRADAWMIVEHHSSRMPTIVI
jgi:hypothetical protein